MAGPFDSAWLKWGRAVTHAQALEADIERVALDSHREPFGTVTAKYDPKRHGFAMVVEYVRPMPVEWNLMLGDVIGNFRACLDHVAWALVLRGRTPNLSEKEARAVSFPIAKDGTKFRSMLTRQLPGVHDADITIVRRYQPYLRGKTRLRWHVLTLLDSMVKSDKHREIQGLWMVPDRASYEITEERDCIVTRHAPTARRHLLEVDTELTLVHARKTGPQPNIEVKYDFTTYPAFNERLSLQWWMQIATIQVMWLLHEFAEQPQEVATLGINRARFERALDAWRANAQLWVDTRTRGTPVAPPF